MDDKTAAFYDLHAAEVAARYESAPSPVARFFPLAFPAGARVLDVGAGSGRDAAALLCAGYDAFAVEPSAGSRLAAGTAPPALRSRLVDGSLPSIGTPFGGDFDGILCCAVLMHLAEAEVFDAALALRRLLKPHGRLLLSIPASRPGLAGDHRDASQRLFHPYTPEQLQLLLERLGFQLDGRWNTDDVLKRADAACVTPLFELRLGTALRAVDQIEGILNRDRKTATYKFALFRALAEIATQEPRAPRWLPEGKVAVSIDRIAKRCFNLHQHRPRHHTLHLLEELALARLLGRQVQAKSELLHGQDRRRGQPVRLFGAAPGYADLPEVDGSSR